MLVNKICMIHNLQESITGCPLCRTKAAKERTRRKSGGRGRSDEQINKTKFDDVRADIPKANNKGGKNK